MWTTRADVANSCLSEGGGDPNKRTSATEVPYLAVDLPSSEAPHAALSLQPSFGGGRCKRIYCSVVVVAFGIWNGTFTASGTRDA